MAKQAETLRRVLLCVCTQGLVVFLSLLLSLWCLVAHNLFFFLIFLLFLSGTFYWLAQPDSLTFAEAVQACLDDGAEIAKVGHIFAAWKLEGYDRCDAGWLADGSVRYPISRPRKNCSPTESAVRFVGFPDKTQKSYGVYCYKAQQ